MKKYIYILTLIIPALVFTSCTESDDEFFPTKAITSNDKIEVNVSGNTLNVSCNFERLINLGTDYPLDLFLTTGSRKFFFNYSLEKRNSSGSQRTAYSGKKPAGAGKS